MSELIENARRRKDLLKHMILQIHQGVAPAQVRSQIIRLLGHVPYDDVVEVEQVPLAIMRALSIPLNFCPLDPRLPDHDTQDSASSLSDPDGPHGTI